MLMSFGKYKGQPVHQLPRRYLKWCLRELTDISPQLRKAMEHGLRGEEYTPPSRQPWKPREPDEVTGY